MAESNSLQESKGMDDNNVDNVKIVSDFLKECKEIQNSWVVAQLTDEYIVDVWPDMKKSRLDGKEDKILEIRIFNTREEYRLFRTSIGKNFIKRILQDDQNSDENKALNESKDYFDEIHYLDIDSNKTKKCGEGGYDITATGGGKYYLPLESYKDARVKIRYYFSKYEKTGQARVKDWRLVSFKCN